MNAYAKVQKSRGVEKIDLGWHAVHVYPNVIELYGRHGLLARFLPEEWAALVQAVGISGLERGSLELVDEEAWSPGASPAAGF